ncbi:Protein of unknown function [Lentibacillus halodurans]|uniref:DUF1878 family protein n=1 Tax=Lentibacillus halodurans TaxID=237679 RepID=A0A1I0W0G7_9BACI|nr:DUF1878 family protein [Lentibacillus halodurans]SFA81416.1 Protein of unknown function [Lentibacillus halodurans]
MLRNKEQNKTTDFHLQLLSKTIDMNQYPLTKMIIENNVTRKEYEELLQLTERLHHHYMKQKEEGFLDFSSLLVQFAGLLNEKLDPNTTVYALKKEGYYPSLMEEFIPHITGSNPPTSRLRDRAK